MKGFDYQRHRDAHYSPARAPGEGEPYVPPLPPVYLTDPVEFIREWVGLEHFVDLALDFAAQGWGDKSLEQAAVQAIVHALRNARGGPRGGWRDGTALEGLATVALYSELPEELWKLAMEEVVAGVDAELGGIIDDEA